MSLFQFEHYIFFLNEFPAAPYVKRTKRLNVLFFSKIARNAGEPRRDTNTQDQLFSLLVMLM